MTGRVIASTPAPFVRAALWLAFLGPLFYLTYGTANDLASRRGHVGAVVFAWERSIPFLDWTILPYWSINLFYAASLFVCTDAAEVDRLGRRLLTAQAIAIACFVAFPLRFTFSRPDTSGAAGFLFNALLSFDKPFNQAPSLHIVLLVILWEFYARHLPRAWGPPLHVWFCLVGLSVLTTYQHHFIDLPTGILVGLLCLWLWPEKGEPPLSRLGAARQALSPLAGYGADRGGRAPAVSVGAHPPPYPPPQGGRGAKRPIAGCANPIAAQAGRGGALALRYALGGLAVAGLAVAIGGAALWLLWGGVALVLVAANYAFIGAKGFQKGADGQMSLAASGLFAPYTAGARLNSLLWTRGERGPAAIADGVMLGRMPTPRDAAALRGAAVTATWLLRTGRAVDIEDAIARIRAARPRIALGADARAAIAEAAR